ncbi:hypothetical protein GUITHDRAFT_142423 [Guillardia theta CCMP2712]|uniref:Uncharacterized protein n=1 Tax=Guillardia theta (strain CCMP2712) TaxID=905079 RepID=L1IXI5_GUITC|nr:hypothetical protein GUITHDRAFT_142423 [Guillardia theta CCMP2712]EKX40782.1 hypothetical protein GUITHDRAFT_142423 [Guillardia theta CCMP2712]|eukprot:XP_005827762.1 hypothetical protein GUITHDRAFT_142423 [Guillardia theta CCMP2712]
MSIRAQQRKLYSKTNINITDNIESDNSERTPSLPSEKDEVELEASDALPSRAPSQAERLARGAYESPSLDEGQVDLSLVTSNSVLEDAGQRPVAIQYMKVCQERKIPTLRSILRDPSSGHVDGSHSRIDCAAIAGVAVIVPQLAGLKSMVLKDNRICDRGCRDLVDALLSTSAGIQLLNLDQNRIGRGGAEALEMLMAAGKVEDLSVAKNKMGDEATARMLKGLLSSECKVERLNISSNEVRADISWNSIRGAWAGEFVRSLSNNTTLKQLNASWNGLGGSEALAKAIDTPRSDASQDKNVFQVHPQGNVAPATILYLSHWLKRTKALDELDLSHNRISSEGGVMLAELERQPDRPVGVAVHLVSHGLEVRTAFDNGERFGLKRQIFLNDCGITRVDAHAFDPSEPAGKYSLDLELSYARTVLRGLLRLSIQGDGQIEDCKLDGKPFSVKFATEMAEDDWNIPTAGLLFLTFHNLKVLPPCQLDCVLGSLTFV